VVPRVVIDDENDMDVIHSRVLDGFKRQFGDQILPLFSASIGGVMLELTTDFETQLEAAGKNMLLRKRARV